MPEHTHTTAVVVIPPVAAWPSIQALRRRLDRQARRWMPHITLLYPFRPRAEFVALAPQFTAACADIAPFELALETFGSFRQSGDQHALWLAPAPPAGRAALLALQTALWQVVPDCDTTRSHSGGFTPHLSVGQVRGARALQQTLLDAQVGWEPLRFTVDEVHLIARGDPPDDVFEVVQTVRIGDRG